VIRATLCLVLACTLLPAVFMAVFGSRWALVLWVAAWVVLLITAKRGARA